ncbi:CPBP family intramembrane metalloprotease [Flavobacteriaceae bacterium AU392]|nr:CPBP family intramembrane metalloprotease [Flavobacteriaceae bacterium]RKM85813.1 CPBP family intramembrane metalloprotease [Flavobacteriaceae bacterium AU392]
MEFNFIYTALVFLIAIVYPIYAILMGGKDKEFLLNNPEKKVHAYKTTALIQVVLCFIILVGLIYNNDGLSLIGLSFITNLLWMTALIISVFIGFWIINKMKIPVSKRESLKPKFDDVIYIIPTTLREYKWAIIISVIVGTLEEIIFRGFLFWQLNHHMHFIIAIITTNVIFGLCHYGTGLKNALNTLYLGTFCSVLYMVTDSLWLPIFVHILVDIHASTLSKKIFIDDKKSESL